MKRIFAIIVAAVLTLTVLTACGGAKNVNLNDLMKKINDTYGLSGLTTVEDSDNLNRYYRTPKEDVKQFAAEFTKAASDGYTEVVIVEANDADAAGRVKTQLETRLRSQLSDAKSYNAEQVSMIEACSVKEKGNFVWLVISDKQADINAEIEKALK
ncbi:DUF4358 domain-containing protein [Ruminococcus sp.]|uniref:DUF4358 domain-containing protein n=1 Tax=Ruminococcus sp. TaxID=41978 RepID=UPI00386F7C0E